MTEAFTEGRGELRTGTKRICSVSYWLNWKSNAEESFTETDGLLTLDGTPESIARVQEELQPYDELTLILEEPLFDGRSELAIRIEPYGGHRPDERLQIRVVG